MPLSTVNPSVRKALTSPYAAGLNSALLLFEHKRLLAPLTASKRLWSLEAERVFVHTKSG